MSRTRIGAWVDIPHARCYACYGQATQRTDRPVGRTHYRSYWWCDEHLNQAWLMAPEGTRPLNWAGAS